MWKHFNVHVIEGEKRKKGKKAGFLPDARLGWRYLPRVARKLYSHGERHERETESAQQCRVAASHDVLMREDFRGL